MNSKQSIIISIDASRDYPLDRLSSEVTAFVRHVLLENQIERGFVERFLRLLNCFLDVANKSIYMAEDGALLGGETSTLFLGAIYSSCFSNFSNGLRQKYARAWYIVVAAARAIRPESFLEIPRPTSSAIENKISEFSSKFESLSLDPEAVYLWRGWRVTSRTGRSTALPLLNIYRRVGPKFTEKLYRAISQYISGRNGGSGYLITIFRYLGEFIINWKGGIGVRELSDTRFFTEFIQKFCRYFVFSHIRRSVWSNVAKIWNRFCLIVKDYLVPAGLVADIKLPALPSGKEGADARTHLQKAGDGTVVKMKLFRSFPLHIKNGAVLDRILADLEADMRVVEKWARTEMHETNSLVQRCSELASIGTPRVLVSPASPGKKAVFTPIGSSRNLADYAATLRTSGFRTRSKPHFESYFPKPRPESLGRELGLPVAGALVPYAALLVMQNPMITPSFLENFQIYDSSGRPSGFVCTNNGWVLDGRKNRRGAKDAQQIIEITDEGRRVVEDVIALTQPLREALKQEGNPVWRSLFLGCGRGFDEVRVVRLSAHTAEPGRVRGLQREFMESCGLGEWEAGDFAKAFSLVRLRAQTTVVSFIKDPDAYRMAMALGHKHYDPKLLSSYLPDALRKFFDERWIRIFQTGLLLISIRDRKLALRATGLKSEAEREELLRNYPIALPAESESKNAAEEFQSENLDDAFEVLLQADHETFVALNSLRLSVEASTTPVGTNALYYSKLAACMGEYIEKAGNVRGHIREMWEDAKKDASAKLFAGALHD
ncbi:hypothetical protein [Burkholderia lata]|uniref:Uncharacterized protein n=1 Tax=Burkholderia lata (strain ATCC 17760 / DSM 23089 / LMG 22485 / NCIMB 9086 / R18194 / 383) TaxID=482957 RepID=A0A6P2XMT2_BURL3|nr:hypothetical protein [Burkholderia lata]VWD09119.1 hypothetical protein BLA18109_05099 [Burkholderia lata]